MVSKQNFLPFQLKTGIFFNPVSQKNGILTFKSAQNPKKVQKLMYDSLEFK